MLVSGNDLESPGADLRSSRLVVRMSGRMPQPIVNTVLFLSNQELFDFYKLYPDHGGRVVLPVPAGEDCLTS